MDCQRIREELVAYLDGELRKGAAEEVRSHLEQCPACKLEAQRLTAAGRILDEIGEIEPAGNFTARVMQRALAARAEPAVARLSVLGRLGAVAAAAVVLVALALWLTVPTGPAGIGELAPEEQEIVENIEILENLELLEDLEILSELELLLEYEEEDFESS